LILAQPLGVIFSSVTNFRGYTGSKIAKLRNSFFKWNVNLDW